METNRPNIGVQLLTIEAARTLRKDDIYQAALLDPHTAAELSIDDTAALCDDLIEAHGSWLPKFSEACTEWPVKKQGLLESSGPCCDLSALKA